MHRHDRNKFETIDEGDESADVWTQLAEKLNRQNEPGHTGGRLHQLDAKAETAKERDKRLTKALKKLQAKKYENYRQKLEDRFDRRHRRQMRRNEGEEDVSEDSEDEELDGYAGLEEIELHIRMANQVREALRQEEIQRLLLADKRAQNTLQNMAMKQEAAAAEEMRRRREEIEHIVNGYKVLKKQVVIQESLSCVHTTLEMCLIGLKEANRFLARSDIQKDFEKATPEQLRVSVETFFQNSKSPIQVKAEMMWRFAVIMQDFMHGSHQRQKYLDLARYAYKILSRMIDEERERRARVRLEGTDEEKSLLVDPAEWDEGVPELGWEFDAIAVSAEQDREAQLMLQLREALEKANNVNAFDNPKYPPRKVAVPDDVYPPAL